MPVATQPKAVFSLSRSGLLFWLAILALLSVCAVIRLSDAERDTPTGVSRDHSLSTDGAWYTAPAIESLRGEPATVSQAYDLSLIHI